MGMPSIYFKEVQTGILKDDQPNGIECGIMFGESINGSPGIIAHGYSEAEALAKFSELYLNLYNNVDNLPVENSDSSSRNTTTPIVTGPPPVSTVAPVAASEPNSPVISRKAKLIKSLAPRKNTNGWRIWNYLKSIFPNSANNYQIMENTGVSKSNMSQFLTLHRDTYNIERVARSTYRYNPPGDEETSNQE